ncbi:MAG: serine/threonine protein kinase [Alphaproteobacteria bacterium]|nr:serine/threonine protein kinase [Alphaproteobacteria bacterium]MCB9699484.1 serine/threonine protein kinase [Alphaproteobacteria bacterium]
MAAVYRARHVQLGSEHAIKVLFVTAPQVRERMFREGQVQARLRHPNIVQVTDVLLVQNAPALVMEYVDGPALDTWLLENRPNVDESLWLFRGILRGVMAAHEGGVVHRDLKPANVLLAPTHDGLVPKVSDFGLVKPVSQVPAKGSLRVNTQSGMALGTPEYMSPEQIRDASDVDQRADMWAMGCILYELLCHRRTFSGPDKMSTFNLIVAGTYEPPRKFVDDLPRHVNEAIRRLLEVKQDDRLASAAELYDLLYDKEEPNVGRLSLGRRPTGPLLASSPHHEITIPPDDPVGGAAPVVISATAPTGIPAARRAQAPTGLRDQRPPRALLTQDSDPRPANRTNVLIPALLVLVVVLSVTVVGLYLALPGQQVEQGLAPMLPPPGEHELTLPPPPPAPVDEPEDPAPATDGR